MDLVKPLLAIVFSILIAALGCYLSHQFIQGHVARNLADIASVAFGFSIWWAGWTSGHGKFSV